MVAADRALLHHGQPQLRPTQGQGKGDQSAGQPAAENGEVDLSVDHAGLDRYSVGHDAQRRPRRARR